jgi:PAS domain S-box-containing protein
VSRELEDMEAAMATHMKEEKQDTGGIQGPSGHRAQKKSMSKRNTNEKKTAGRLDVTDRPQAEETFRLFAETSLDILYQLDEGGIITYCSPAVERTLGYTPAEIEGASFERFLQAHEVPRAKKVFQQARSLNNIRFFEIDVLGKSGNPVPIEFNVAPVIRNKKTISLFGIGRDITRRKQTEQALRVERMQLQRIIDQLPEGILVTEAAGRVTLTNEKFQEIWGSSDEAEKIEDYHWYKAFHPDGSPYLPNEWPLARAIAQRETVPNERIQFYKRDGSLAWISVNATPLFDEGDRLVGAVAVISDITERVREKERYREMSEQMLSQLLELEAIYASAPVGLAVFDRDFRFVKVNERMAKFNGISVNEHIGHTPWEIVPSIAPQAEALFREIMDTGEGQWNIEFIGTTRDQPGATRLWKEHWLPMKDQEGLVIGVNVVAEEITEQIRMVEERREAHNSLEKRVADRTAQLSRANEQLETEMIRRKRFESDLRSASRKILEASKKRAYLSARLVETLERDRRDVAMYLHDQIGQMLATLKMDMEYTRNAPVKEPRLYRAKLQGFEEKIISIMAYVKEISSRLRPDILDTLGLIPAFRSLITSFEEDYGLSIHFHFTEPFRELDADISLSIYRIAQEALNNIAKHAEAEEVFVTLVLKKAAVQLTVEDDGIGFDLDSMENHATGQGPLGLMIMKERAALAEGELTLESEIGKGTLVSVEIPV